jgi:hypothetical protein
MYLFIEGRRGYYYLARYPELVIYEYTHLFRIMYVKTEQPDVSFNNSRNAKV